MVVDSNMRGNHPRLSSIKHPSRLNALWSNIQQLHILPMWRLEGQV